MKRYSLHFTVNEINECIHPAYVLGRYDRFWGNANSVKSLRGCVKEIIRRYPDAHNFRIYDHSFDDIEATAYEHCVCKRWNADEKWVEE